MALALIPAGFARNASTVPGMMEKYKTQTGMPKPADKAMAKNKMMGTVMSIIKNRMSVRQTARTIREMKNQADRKMVKRVAAPLKYFIASSAMTSAAASSALSGTTSSAASSATSSN